MHSGIANPRGKRSRHSRRMRSLQFYVSGKRPMATLNVSVATYSTLDLHKITDTVQKASSNTISCKTFFYFDSIFLKLPFNKSALVKVARRRTDCPVLTHNLTNMGNINQPKTDLYNHNKQITAKLSYWISRTRCRPLTIRHRSLLLFNGFIGGNEFLQLMLNGVTLGFIFLLLLWIFSCKNKKKVLSNDCDAWFTVVILVIAYIWLQNMHSRTSGMFGTERQRATIPCDNQGQSKHSALQWRWDLVDKVII